MGYDRLILYVRHHTSIKEGIDFNRIKSYDFGRDLAKCLAMPHVARRNLNGLRAVVQLKMNLFLGKALEQPEPKPEIEAKFDFCRQNEEMQITLYEL